MRLYQITSKKTKHSEVIDQDTYDMLTVEDKRKYIIEPLPEAKKIVPSEIIIKKTVTKPQKDND